MAVCMTIMAGMHDVEKVVVHPALSRLVLSEIGSSDDWSSFIPGLEAQLGGKISVTLQLRDQYVKSLGQH